MISTLSQLEEQWPACAALVRELGVTCSLVVPLVIGEEVLGALSLYGTAADCGPTVAQNLGELVADLASTALSCMARHAEKTELTEELQQAPVSRSRACGAPARTATSSSATSPPSSSTPHGRPELDESTRPRR